MFNKYEPLLCVLCGSSFAGRKPTEGGDVLCPGCLAEDELKVISGEADIPPTVKNEVEGGRGDAE